MSRIEHKKTLLLLAAVAAATMTAAPATQAAAASIERWEWSDQGVIEDCAGVTVMWEGEGEDSLMSGARGAAGLTYFKYRTDGSVDYTNPATGLTMTTTWNYIDKDLEVVDNGDGTLTITVLATGNAQLWSPSGRLVRRDPGQIRHQVLIDHNGTPTDPTDDEFIEDLGVIKGSTGLNEFEDADFCEDVDTYLG